MKWHCTIIVATLVLLTVAAGPAMALPTIYGSAYLGTGGPASLYTIDPTTGAATLVGAIGFNSVGGIDFDPLNGLLYGTGRTASGTNVLISINPLTGAGTQIGALGIGNNVQDISFRSDGTLFAFANATNSNGNIYTISTLTGAATLVGPTGFSGFSGDGLAFSPSDTLFTVNNADIQTVDQMTGAGTVVTNMNYVNGLGTNERANGMDFDPATGTLWASVNNGFIASGPNYLETIDVSTGNATLIGQTQAGMDALAVALVASVPEPSTWAAGLLTAGALFRSLWRGRIRLS